MNTDVNPVAEPSAAPIQYDAWDDKGTPIVKAQPKAQDSAPVEKPEKPDIAAEPGAAKEKESKPKKLTADERIAQLEATIERIKQAKAEPTKQAEPSAAKPEPKLEAPKKPDIKDFKGDDAFERYEAAKDEYYEKLADYKAELKAQQALEKFQQQQAKAEADRKFNEELSKTKERHPDFDDVAKPAAQKLWNDPQVPQIVKDRLARSPLLMDVMYVLGGDEKQFSEFVETAKSDPVAAIEKLGVLQHLIREELRKKSSARGEDGKFKAAEEKETPVQPQPRAPKPVSEVGGRGTAPEDPAMAAVRANDFKTASAEWDRRAFASRK